MFEVVAGSVTEPILRPSRKLTLLPTDGLEVLFGRWNFLDFALGIPLVLPPCTCMDPMLLADPMPVHLLSLVSCLLFVNNCHLHGSTTSG